MRKYYRVLSGLIGGLLVIGLAPVHGQGGGGAGGPIECPPDGVFTAWTCDVDGSWFAPTCWSVGIPTAADDVLINRPGADPTVTVDASAEFCDLANHDWLLLQAPGILTGRTIDQYGEMNIRPGPADSWATINNAAMINHPGALLSIESPGDFLGVDGNGITGFENDGTVVITGNANAQFSESWDNPATLTNNGAIGVGSGARASFHFDSASNSGTMAVDSGASAYFTFATVVNQSGGLLEAADPNTWVDVAGPDAPTILENHGHILAHSGGVFRVYGDLWNYADGRGVDDGLILSTGEGSAIQLERHWEDDYHDVYTEGTIEATDGARVNIDSGGDGYCEVVGTGRIGASTGGRMSLISTSVAATSPLALFAHGEGSRLSLENTYANVGGLDLTAGASLGLSGSVTIAIPAGLTIPDGVTMDLECCEGPSVSIYGPVDVEGNVYMPQGGDLYVGDTFMLGGGGGSFSDGSVTVSGPFTVAGNASLSNVDLSAYDTLSVPGWLNMHESSVYVQEETTADGGIYMWGGRIDVYAALNLRGTLEVYEGAEVYASGPVTVEDAAYLWDGLLATDGTLMVTAPDARLQINRGRINAAGPFTNDGTVVAAAEGESVSIDAPFTNSGLLEVRGSGDGLELHGSLFNNQGAVVMRQSGRLSIQTGSITQQGTVDLWDYTNLDLPYGMTNDGTINLWDGWISGDTLTNANGASIHAGNGNIYNSLVNGGLVSVSDGWLGLEGYDLINFGTLEALSDGTLWISAGDFGSLGDLIAQGWEARIEIEADTALLTSVTLSDGAHCGIWRGDCTITGGLYIPESCSADMSANWPATLHADVDNAGWFTAHGESWVDGSLTNTDQASFYASGISGGIANERDLFLAEGVHIGGTLVNAEGASAQVTDWLTGGPIQNAGYMLLFSADVANDLHNTDGIDVLGGGLAWTALRGSSIVNQGTIQIVTSVLELDSPSVEQSGAIEIGLLGGLHLSQDLTNNGEIELWSAGWILGPASLQNEGWLGGDGSIETDVFNRGMVEARPGDALEFLGEVLNHGEVVIWPGATVSQEGGSFVNGRDVDQEVVGAVTILADGAFVLSDPFTSRGNVFLNAGLLAPLGGMTNRAAGVVEGFGTIAGDVTNHGMIELYGDSSLIGDLNNGVSPSTEAMLLVRNQDLLITGHTVNYGTIETLNGRIIFEGGLENYGTLNFDPAALLISDLIVGPDGVLEALDDEANEFIITGDFQNESDENQLWRTEWTILRFNGGDDTTSQFEAASTDYGATCRGYQSNFAWGTLHVGPSETTLILQDQSQNGTSGQPEAVYVTNLILDAGATLDLNGLNLYYRGLFGGDPDSVIGGEMTFVPLPSLDGDGDMDLHDFAKFQACYTDAGGGGVEPGCAAADFDGDEDVDMDDFVEFHCWFFGPQ